MPEDIEDDKSRGTEEHQVVIEDHYRGCTKDLQRIDQGDANYYFRFDIAADEQTKEHHIDKKDERQPDEKGEPLGEVGGAGNRRE